MKRDNLNTMFGNTLSQAAGFSPEILAILPRGMERGSWAFSAKNKSSQADQEVEEESPIPEGFEFLADKVMVEED